MGLISSAIFIINLLYHTTYCSIFRIIYKYISPKKGVFGVYPLLPDHASWWAGGPFPAITDSRTTFVGTAAIKRFVRPICYQDFPQGFLPDELKDRIPLNILRMLNGEWVRGKIS
jgi:hypothetical protein